ncbi:MAG: hypothetical protein KF832_13755 [Caldilineaceae bacterium]|nr:hypothetical protein [Caldilineaceae bacterium]
MAVQVVTSGDIGDGLAIADGKLQVKLGAGLVLDDAAVAVDQAALTPTVEMSLTGEVITVTVNGVSADQDLTSVVTDLYGTPAFTEAVQDAVGQAVMAGAGITYDDVMNALYTTLGSTVIDGWGLYVDENDNHLKVGWDPATPLPIEVTELGIKVGTPTALQIIAALNEDELLVDVQDLGGTHLFYGIA